MLTVNESLTVAITFKPARANGLIMLLTTENSSKAIFAAGLRNGRVFKQYLIYIYRVLISYPTVPYLIKSMVAFLSNEVSLTLHMLKDTNELKYGTLFADSCVKSKWLQ